MKLSFSSSPFKGALALVAPFIVLSTFLSSARCADSCYYCGNCTGSMVASSLQDVFGVIGTTNKVDDYILDENAGKMALMAFPACAADTASISKMTLDDEAKGTNCMSLYFTIKDDTVVTNTTTNIMVSCMVLGGVSQLFKDYSANMTEAEYRANIGKLTTAGIVEDIMGLKSSASVEDVNGGAVFCSGDNCNMLPTNDKVDIKVTVTGYDVKYEDKTSTEYMGLKSAGELVAEKMCESLSGTCTKSGFDGFNKVKASSGSRRRRSAETYNTQVLIFVETSPGTMPAETELTNIYRTALASAQATGGIAILASFTDEIEMEITMGGTEDSGTLRLSPSFGVILALLCLLVTRNLA